MPFNCVAHIGDDAAQLVGADVSMGINDYGWVGTMFDKTVQHLLYVAALIAAGVQFAVGIGARPTFAKTPVTVMASSLVLWPSSSV